MLGRPGDPRAPVGLVTTVPGLDGCTRVKEGLAPPRLADIIRSWPDPSAPLLLEVIEGLLPETPGEPGAKKLPEAAPAASGLAPAAASIFSISPIRSRLSLRKLGGGNGELGMKPGRLAGPAVTILWLEIGSMLVPAADEPAAAAPPPAPVELPECADAAAGTGAGDAVAVGEGRLVPRADCTCWRYTAASTPGPPSRALWGDTARAVAEDGRAVKPMSLPWKRQKSPSPAQARKRREDVEHQNRKISLNIFSDWRV